MFYRFYSSDSFKPRYFYITSFHSCMMLRGQPYTSAKLYTSLKKHIKYNDKPFSNRGKTACSSIFQMNSKQGLSFRFIFHLASFVSTSINVSIFLKRENKKQINCGLYQKLLSTVWHP